MFKIKFLSSKFFITLIKEIINKIHEEITGETYKSVSFYQNIIGFMCVQEKVAINKGFDWELFQNLAPRCYYRNNAWNYSCYFGTSESSNNATHKLDIARWTLDLKYPDHVDVH